VGYTITVRLWLVTAAIVSIIAMTAWGSFVWHVPPPTRPAVTPPGGPGKTFYIVVHHWGFAIYDSEWNEIPRIVVQKGDTVTLYVIPAEALTEEAHEEFEERTIQRGIGDLPPNDPKIMDKIEEAEEAGLLNHSVAILEYGINIPTDVSKVTSKANSPREAFLMGNPGGGSVTFTADKVGRFDIICLIFCGYGHPWMVLRGGLEVVAGG
jgi:hypothetical protein